MDTNYSDNNHLILVGKVTSEKRFSHEIYGENNEVNEGGRFRYLYELPDTIINKDHNIYRGWTLEGNIYDFNTPVTKNITIKSIV